jgi:uncharacterized protein YkwD
VARSRRRGLLAVLAGLAVCVGLTAESPQAAVGRTAANPAGAAVVHAPQAAAPLAAPLPAPVSSRPTSPAAERAQLPAAEQRTAYPRVAASSKPSTSKPADSPADAARAAQGTTRQTTSKHTTTSSMAPSTAASRHAPKPPAKASGSSWSTAARAVLAQLNAERAAHGLRALRMDSRLVSSAHTHNLAMAAHNQMSHQLPGEAWFADRILAAGYPYVYAGENVGWNSVRTVAGALQLETMMYTEKPPNDGHRQNILSPHYTQIGVDVYVDPGTGKIWLTEDFGSRS